MGCVCGFFFPYLWFELPTDLSIITTIIKFLNVALTDCVFFPILYAATGTNVLMLKIKRRGVVAKPLCQQSPAAQHSRSPLHNTFGTSPTSVRVLLYCWDPRSEGKWLGGWVRRGGWLFCDLCCVCNKICFITKIVSISSSCLRRHGEGWGCSGRLNCSGRCFKSRGSVCLSMYAR